MIACGGNEAPAADAEQTTAVSQEQNDDAVSSGDSEEEDMAVQSSKATKEAEKETKAVKDSSKSTKEQAAKPTKEQTKEPTKSTTAATKATEAAKVCYITIEGYCSSKSITVKSGDSVYDILKRSGANVSARNTGYGLYIEGINGRYEFDEGPSSGWVYSVNGSRPSTSCSKYSVSSGDKIVWSYVK